MRVEMLAALKRPRVGAVAKIENQCVGREGLQARAPADCGLEKCRVFRQRRVGIAGTRAEQMAPEDKRAAVHVANKKTLMELRGAAPKFPSIQVEEGRSRQPRDVGGAGQQWRDLGGEPIGRIPIVIVPVRDDRAAGKLAGAIALGPDVHLLADMDMADTRIARKIVARSE